MLKSLKFQSCYKLSPKYLIALLFKQKHLSVKQFCTTQYLSSGPVDMAYNEYNSTDADSGTPPLIIMHGLLGSKTNWRGLSKSLLTKFKPTRKIYTVDARNHGESPHTQIHNYESLSLDLEHFFQDQNIEKAVMMGHSMGGRAIMYFALKNPNLVDRAIVLDISPIDVPRDFAQMRVLLEGMESANIPKGTPLPKARNIVEEHLKKATQTEGPFDFILQNLKKSEDGIITWAPNLKTLINGLSKIGAFPQDILKSNQYRGPTLFIGGTQSNYINPDHWHEVQKIFPNSDLVWFDCGHLVHFEQPQQFIEQVTKFMNNPL